MAAYSVDSKAASMAVLSVDATAVSTAGYLVLRKADPKVDPMADQSVSM